MRTITLRVWDTLKKEFIDLDPICKDWALCPYMGLMGIEKNEIGSFLFMPSERYIWLQWTGLLDKKGKMIFQGDIVRDVWGSAMEVAWMNEKAGFVRKIKEYILFGMETANKNLEVIGNIYQNGDLIK